MSRYGEANDRAASGAGRMICLYRWRPVPGARERGR